MDKQLIRRFMHHASLESQEIYTQASSREAMAELTAAAQRLRERYPSTSAATDQLLHGLERNV
ncbi:hypothetical protein [Pseudomonas chlororaphis]|uniref:hypothetical protein n=1 Tax=Pseudomonas chlororaphis TaxID=587753 RepID=UPI001E2ED1AB|nr:hypothetical protein [Pseudomonas chlororaphis]